MNQLQRARPTQVGVLTKVLRIFDVLHHSRSALSLTEICRETGLNKSTSHRFLSHLEREGWINRDEKGAYTFGVKLLEMAATFHHHLTLRELARPAVRELWKATGETVNLAVLDRAMVLYVDVLESPHEFRLVSTVGMRRPVHSTALGKALVAFLPAEERDHVLSAIHFTSPTPHTIGNLAEFTKELDRVRQDGYSIDDEESVLGARCVGAAVRNAAGEAVAAISIAGPITRISQDKVPVFAAAVGQAARTISGRLGFE